MNLESSQCDEEGWGIPKRAFDKFSEKQETFLYDHFQEEIVKKCQKKWKDGNSGKQNGLHTKYTKIVTKTYGICTPSLTRQPVSNHQNWCLGEKETKITKTLPGSYKPSGRSCQLQSMVAKYGLSR